MTFKIMDSSFFFFLKSWKISLMTCLSDKISTQDCSIRIVLPKKSSRVGKKGVEVSNNNRRRASFHWWSAVNVLDVRESGCQYTIKCVWLCLRKSLHCSSANITRKFSCNVDVVFVKGSSSIWAGIMYRCV